MPRIDITDLDDPRLEPYCNLKDTNRTRWQNLFIAEGKQLVRRLLASRYETDSLLVGHKQVSRFAPLAPPEVPVLVLPDEQINQVVGFKFHHGVLACGRRRPGPLLAEIVFPIERSLTLVVCADVQDPENLGSILRVSAAFGADAVVLGGATGDPFSRRVLRISMGASFRLPIVRIENVDDLKHACREANIQLAGAVLDPEAETLHQAARPPRLGILFGNEAHGLNSRWLELCDRKVVIPMHPGTDSLNVGVATGIFLYHFIARGGESSSNLR